MPKCGYAKCKLGGEVDKERAVKVGSRYWHEECVRERDLKNDIESFYYEQYQSREPIIAVRKAISNYIDRDRYDSEYVLWCLKSKKPKLNSLHGLSYTLSYKANEVEFKKYKASLLKFDFGDYNRDDIKTQVEPKKDKKWEDYFNVKN
jgi:hypothetical protein